MDSWPKHRPQSGARHISPTVWPSAASPQGTEGGHSVDKAELLPPAKKYGEMHPKGHA